MNKRWSFTLPHPMVIMIPVLLLMTNQLGYNKVTAIAMSTGRAVIGASMVL